MTMITPSYLGETIEYSSLHACRSTLEDPTACSSASFTAAAWRASPSSATLIPMVFVVGLETPEIGAPELEA